MSTATRRTNDAMDLVTVRLPGHAHDGCGNCSSPLCVEHHVPCQVDRGGNNLLQVRLTDRIPVACGVSQRHPHETVAVQIAGGDIRVDRFENPESRTQCLVEDYALGDD